MKHICLFGGAGVGKSTIASGLFYEMKTRNMSVEYLTEYAKGIVYKKDFTTLQDQLLITATQHHPWTCVKKDFSINDGAFLLGCIYGKESKHFPKNLFDELIIQMFKSYDTVNYFLVPDFDYYEQNGRIETKQESEEISAKILNLLIENGIPFKTLKSNKDSVKEILLDLGL